MAGASLFFLVMSPKRSMSWTKKSPCVIMMVRVGYVGFSLEVHCGNHIHAGEMESKCFGEGFFLAYIMSM